MNVSGNPSEVLTKEDLIPVVVGGAVGTLAIGR
jgi:hypothetical protein